MSDIEEVICPKFMKHLTVHWDGVKASLFMQSYLTEAMSQLNSLHLKRLIWNFIFLKSIDFILFEPLMFWLFRLTVSCVNLYTFLYLVFCLMFQIYTFPFQKISVFNKKYLFQKDILYIFSILFTDKL